MRKNLGFTGVVVAVAALAVSSVAPATGGGDHHGDRDKIRVLSTTTEEAFVDLDEPDFSLGDMFVFSADLTKHGRQVGRAGVVCTVTSVEREEAQCLGTASLRKGQITVQGLLVGEEEVFELAITGGTGAFEGAGGTLVVKELSETKELLTFHFSD